MTQHLNVKGTNQVLFEFFGSDVFFAQIRFEDLHLI
jgi:hypothetical protein